MSPFDRDATQHLEPPTDAQTKAPVPTGSYSEAESSSAHIAELVRRTAERQARPGPSSIVRPQVMAAQPPAPAPAPTVTQPISEPAAQPVTWLSAPQAARLPAPTVAQPVSAPLAGPFAEAAARPLAQPVTEPPTEPDRHPARPALRQPSRRVLVVAGAIATVLVAGGFALSDQVGSDTKATSAASAAQVVGAPAGYAVRITDVITDCRGHSHGRTKSSFRAQNCVRATRSVATGRLNGRPVLFVGSRIQMRSVDCAAAVKQVLDATGTGNLNDLLREGRTFPGAPAKVPVSGYASIQTGAVVVVSEAGFVDGGPSSNSTPALRAAAAQVAALLNAGG